MVALNTHQRKFLAHCTLDADKPLAQQAKECGLKPQQLQYAVRSLLDKQIVHVMPWFDRSKLGLTDYHLYFSIAAGSPASREAFATSLSRAEGVVYLGYVGGDFHYELILAATTAHAAAELLDSMCERHRVQVQAKSIATGLTWRFYPKRYLVADQPTTNQQTKMLETASEQVVPVPQLDALDQKLLRALSADASESLRELGRSLGLAHTAVRYRIERLRELGILRSRYYDVEPLLYGHHEFLLQYSVTQQRKRHLARLLSVADHTSAVCHAAAYFGAWDFELGIEVPKAEDIVQLSQAISDLLGPDFVPTRMLMRFRFRSFRGYPF